jgi:hypothetical protein
MNPSAIDPNTAVAIVVVGLLALLPAIDTMRRWFGGAAKREISPNPLVVEPSKRYAEREDCMSRHDALDSRITTLEKRMDERMEGFRTELRSDLGEMRKEVRAQIGGVHQRVDTVLAAVSDVAGQIKRMGGKDHPV